jgi:rhamnosyltransferase subunit B
VHFLLTSIGSHGDINPFIAVGAALGARGHEVTLLANDHFRDQAIEAGLHHEPLGETFDLTDLAKYPDVMHARRGPEAVFEHMVYPMVRETFVRISEIHARRKIDAVAHHHISFGAPWACERLGIPAACVALAPMMWFASDDAFAVLPWMPMRPPRWLTKLLLFVLPPMMRHRFDGRFNQIRAELGLAKSRDVFLNTLQHSALPLGLWSRHFRPPFPGDPPGAVTCGFPWHDRHGAIDDSGSDLARFLDDGPPPVLFSLGTAAVHTAGDFYDLAAKSCARLGVRGILLTGPKRTPPSNLPAGVRAFAYAPFSSVMPRCAASVHHAGIGSTAQALRSGRPFVCVPHAHDQFDNSARAVRLGVASKVHRSGLNVARLTAALRAVLDAPEIAAEAARIGTLVQQEDGAVVAAAALEALAARR